VDNRLFQLGIFAISVAGYVTLALKGEATAEYVTLIGPVLGAGYVVSHLGKQDNVLGEIKEQTNGVLDQRIKDGVKAALTEREGSDTE
jgi:hypothetical protein